MSLSFLPKPTFDRSVRHFSDEAIGRCIYSKHHYDSRIKIDIDNYIVLVESVITTADRIALTISEGIKGPFTFSNDFLNDINEVDPPLCTILHQISSELACKGGPGIEKAHQTTLNILDILESYPWEAKAILTLTAFAAEYGDIWHLSHYASLDPLAKSLSIIKRVPFLKRQLNSFKFRQVLLSPDCLIISCLRAIKYMNQIKKYFSKLYDNGKELLSDISWVLRQVPLVSYWVIHIIVAAQIEISSYLNGTEGQPQKYLNELSEKISFILNLLEKHLNIIREQQGNQV